MRTDRGADQITGDWFKEDLITFILERREDLLDDRYLPLIYKTLMRIPKDVLEILEFDRQILFVTVTDEFYATTKSFSFFLNAIPLKKRGVTRVDRFVVIINDMTMRKLSSQEDRMSVIAHEAAHVYLGHSRFENKDIEKEANDLIKSWGFNPKIRTKHR